VHLQQNLRRTEGTGLIQLNHSSQVTNELQFSAISRTLPTGNNQPGSSIEHSAPSDAPFPATSTTTKHQHTRYFQLLQQLKRPAAVLVFVLEQRLRIHSPAPDWQHVIEATGWFQNMLLTQLDKNDSTYLQLLCKSSAARFGCLKEGVCASQVFSMQLLTVKLKLLKLLVEGRASSFRCLQLLAQKTRFFVLQLQLLLKLLLKLVLLLQLHIFASRAHGNKQLLHQNNSVSITAVGNA
jgi:hypothetical protein